jgi:ABC-type antimicrobial peptide transport system permease subunit
VPAVADQSVITWGLGKSVGDTIIYTDEKGDPFEVELVASLAGSILQGDIIISEDAFLDGFPSISGTRVFLVDVPESNGDNVKSFLAKQMRDRGLELEGTTARLAEFLVVENTYLSIFLELGGLGLLLGSCGLGLVVLRNTAERRSELALLRGVGFSRGRVFRMVFTEHCFLLIGGLLCGLISAGIAVIPVLFVSGTDVPLRFIGAVSLAIIINGVLWTAAATGISLRGNLIHALRSE